MRKSNCGKAIPFKRTLVAFLVLAFAGQSILIVASASTKASVNLSPSGSSERLILLTDSGIETRLLSLVSQGTEQPGAKTENRNSKPSSGLIRRHLNHAKFLSGPRVSTSPKRKAGCREDCLAESLACIAISILSGCAPCGLVCLAYEIYCVNQCHTELLGSNLPRVRNHTRK